MGPEAGRFLSGRPVTTHLQPPGREGTETHTMCVSVVGACGAYSFSLAMTSLLRK